MRPKFPASCSAMSYTVLADAYDERLMSDHPDRTNPFRAEKERVKVIPLDEPQMNFTAISRTSRRKAREGRLLRCYAHEAAAPCD